MSIALERNNSGGGGHRIEGPGLVHLNSAWPYASPELAASDRSPAEVDEEDRSGSLSSSSTSSIGKNSDEHSGGGSGSGGEEVQSEYKGGPLDSLDCLEEVLPVKYVILLEFFWVKTFFFFN